MFKKRNVSGRIVDRYVESQNKKPMHGMNIAAVESMGDNSARFIISSPTARTASIVKSFIMQATNYAMDPKVETFTAFQSGSKHFASIIAVRAAKRIVPVEHPEDEPMVASMRFHEVSANTFMDAEFSDVWKKETIGGKEFFTRDNHDDLKKVIDTAQFKFGGVTASVDIKQFVPAVAEGDIIEFFAADSKGTKNVFGRVMKIESGEGGTILHVEHRKIKYNVPMLAVTKKLPFDTGATPEDVVEYMRVAYPEDYSNILDQINIQ